MLLEDEGQNIPWQYKGPVPAHPGHTPGTMSIFSVSDEYIYRAGMHGGVGTNSMSKEFLDRYGLSYDCRKQFLDGLDRLKQEKVDIFIGNHVWNNDTRGKYERMKSRVTIPLLMKTTGWNF